MTKEKFYFTLAKPVTLIEGALVNPTSFQQNAEPTYYGTFGITDTEDCQTIFNLAAKVFQKELGCPYDMTKCQSSLKTGAYAADEAIFYSQGKDDAKIQRAQQKAEIFRPFPLVLKLNSKYAPALVRQEGEKQVEITPDYREWADKELFYSGAKVYISGQLYGYRRKTMQAQDGLTGFIHGVMFHSHGEKLIDFSGHRSGTELFKGFTGVSTINPTKNSIPSFGTPVPMTPPMSRDFIPKVPAFDKDEEDLPF